MLRKTSVRVQHTYYQKKNTHTHTHTHTHTYTHTYTHTHKHIHTHTQTHTHTHTHTQTNTLQNNIKPPEYKLKQRQYKICPNEIVTI